MPAKDRTGLLAPSAPMRMRAAILDGSWLEVTEGVEVKDNTGQLERSRPSGSSWPYVIDETLVLESNDESAPSSDIRSKRALVRLEFSVIVATIRGGALYCRASAFQSNWIEASFEASQTCI